MQHVFHKIFLGGSRVIMRLYGGVTMAVFYSEDLSKNSTGSLGPYFEEGTLISTFSSINIQYHAK